MSVSTHTYSDADRLKYKFDGFLATWQFFPEGAPFSNFILGGDVAASLSALPDRRMRIGHVAELFFAAAIRADKRYEIAGSQIQIVQDGRTLGELDFLLREVGSQKLIHVELAYKLYLYMPDADKPMIDRFIGPNKRDSWAAKYQKLCEKQFPLFHHASTVRVLHELGIDTRDVKQALCLKMQVFLPIDFHGPLPDRGYRSAVCGVWIKAAQFTEAAFPGCHFACPQKADWFIAPETEAGQAFFEWMDYPAVQKAMAPWRDRKLSPFVYARAPGGSVTRLFIVWW